MVRRHCNGGEGGERRIQIKTSENEVRHRATKRDKSDWLLVRERSEKRLQEETAEASSEE